MYKHVKIIVLLVMVISTSLLADDRETLLKTGKTELVYGIGGDNLIYITKVDTDSGYREVLISLDGKYSVNDLRPAVGKNGSTFVLAADFYKDYNESAKVGKPIVIKEQGKLAKIKVFVVTEPEAKNITGERRFITTDELAALPCSRDGYHYGISTKDELLYVSNTNNNVILIHPKDSKQEDPKPAVNSSKNVSLSPVNKEMVLVDAKAIQVLSESDNKMITIKFDKPFYMDKYEVTNAEYRQFIQATNRATPASWKGQYPEEKGDYPVLVDWAGAKAYAKWAGKQLPSYNQWQAAVTDPKNQITLWTTEPLMIYYNKYGILKSGVGSDMYQLGMSVGKCEPDKSPYGVYGLLGNVQEWTSTEANLQDLPEGKTAVRLAGYAAQSTGPFGEVSVNGNSHAFADYDCYGFRCVSYSDLSSGNDKTAQKIDSSDSILPKYKMELKGNNLVRIVNPNDFSVHAGIRSGEKGSNINITAGGTGEANVPNGKYDIYFVYSNKPDALFQGDSFSLNNNGIEIQIVKVVEGNYHIRQVK